MNIVIHHKLVVLYKMRKIVYKSISTLSVLLKIPFSVLVLCSFGEQSKQSA